MPAPEGSSGRLSPPNVSALLDISLPGPPEDVLSQGEPATHISDSIIEIAISSGQYGEGRGAVCPLHQSRPGLTAYPGICTLAGHTACRCPEFPLGCGPSAACRGAWADGVWTCRAGP